MTGEAAADGKFVLRPKYPTLQTISTADLSTRYDQAVIVDVRSKIEYEVVHINKAVHLPVALGNFLTELEKLRNKTAAEPMAFYCNGYDCAKSYDAVDMATKAGFRNIFVYDGGINEWVQTHPERSTLMGKTPAPKDKLISDAAFLKRKIGYADFAKRAAQPESIVIDIREPFQRTENENLPQSKSLALAEVRSIPSDRLVGLLSRKEFQGKQLLITDAVGKQVRWMQYYLEENGYKDYFFLKDGILTAVEAGAAR